ncbi:hypothetical protein AnigIFM63326_002091 [Aspergillus niger]|nr:hypothetical protein AnigIFM63326_002091 [Aspergillus niger]
MPPGDGIRRDIAHISAEERGRLRDAIIKLHKNKFYPGDRNDNPTGGVSYWFKQDEIHAHTHVHGSPAFLPWHRELVNRFEALIREIDPTLSLHYWDWTKDPQNLDDGHGGNFSLFTADFMGSASGEAGEPWRSNGFYDPNASSTRSDNPFDPNNNPVDPPRLITRNVSPGSPVTGNDDQATVNLSSYPAFRNQIEGYHGLAHGHIGGSLSNPHTSFRDPFVFLLHSGLDRLFALWQLSSDVDVRLDPEQVYSFEGNSTGSGDVHTLRPFWGILSPVEPWAGPAAQNTSTGVISNVRATRPWAPPENQQNLPESQKNHKHWTIVKPPRYDTNPTVVEVLNPGNIISFNQVPARETTVRAATFRFISSYPVNFSVTSGPGPPFSVFTRGGTVSISGSNDSIWSEAKVWFSFTAGPANETAPSSPVTIHCETTNYSQDFTFTLTGMSIPRPTAAVVLALDQSGSMNEPAGTTGLRRIDALKYAAKQFVEVIQPGNAIGLIRFDHIAYAPNDSIYPGLPLSTVGEGIFDQERTNARNAVNAHATNIRGSTSIGAGILQAHQVLNTSTSWDVKSIVVFTDGLENTPPIIQSAMNSINSRTFAIGLGNPQQIDTVALNAITNATGGYVYITGALGPTDEDFFKLTKYFLQILAGVTNTDIVVDPVGFLPHNSEIHIPFAVADVDIEVTVVLSVDVPAVDIYLITPLGKKITPSNANGLNVSFSTADNTSLYRFTLPVTIDSEQESTGNWEAVLQINEKQFKKYCEPQVTHGETTPTPCRRGGARYNASVYAWSNLHLRANVYQDTSRPGTSITIRTLLDEYGVPFGGSANVVTHVACPDGTHFDISLGKIDNGVYEGEFKAVMHGFTRSNN